MSWKSLQIVGIWMEDLRSHHGLIRHHEAIWLLIIHGRQSGTLCVIIAIEVGVEWVIIRVDMQLSKVV